jgi:hypothetical protein
MKITSQPEDSRKNGRPTLRWLDLVLKHLQTLVNEHMVKKSMIYGVKSSGRTRHTRGCSAKKEEYQHSQGLYPLSPTFKMSML